MNISTEIIYRHGATYRAAPWFSKLSLAIYYVPKWLQRFMREEVTNKFTL